VYWVIWAQILPRIGGYELVRETIVERDGWGRVEFVRRRV
jgi:hypothetical protein